MKSKLALALATYEAEARVIATSIATLKALQKPKPKAAPKPRLVETPS